MSLASWRSTLSRKLLLTSVLSSLSPCHHYRYLRRHHDRHRRRRHHHQLRHRRRRRRCHYHHEMKRFQYLSTINSSIHASVLV